MNICSFNTRITKCYRSPCSESCSCIVCLHILITYMFVPSRNNSILIFSTQIANTKLGYLQWTSRNCRNSRDLKDSPTDIACKCCICLKNDHAKNSRNIKIWILNQYLPCSLQGIICNKIKLFKALENTSTPSTLNFILHYICPLRLTTYKIANYLHTFVCSVFINFQLKVWFCWCSPVLRVCFIQKRFNLRFKKPPSFTITVV